MSGWYNKLKESKLNLIAGPCVLESKEHAFEMSGSLKEICDELEINFIYKTSYDKANRTSKDSFRGVLTTDSEFPTTNSQMIYRYNEIFETIKKKRGVSY